MKIGRQMDGTGQEIKNLIKIWILAVLSLCYCRFISNWIPKGIPRLLSLLPIIFFFLILPLLLPLSVFHLAGPTVFYLVWLANFKLLLLSFDLGPLASPKPLPISIFLSVALLPINPKRKTDADPIPSHKPFLLAVKALLLAFIVRLYDYRHSLHPNLILALYCCHVYLGVELVLALTAFLVRVFLGSGFEIEPQFNEPYLATSLQDFWGRRWNLMVTGILRPTVYNPVRAISMPLLGKRWGSLPAIFAAFLVSGLMHELIYFYLTRAPPTWEVTCFFVLHGLCTGAEVVVKKAVNGRFRLHRLVSGTLTLTFAAVTGSWLFFPQLLRNSVDLKTINEYSIVVNLVRSKLSFH